MTKDFTQVWGTQMNAGFLLWPSAPLGRALPRCLRMCGCLGSNCTLRNLRGESPTAVICFVQPEPVFLRKCQLKSIFFPSPREFAISRNPAVNPSVEQRPFDNSNVSQLIGFLNQGFLNLTASLGVGPLEPSCGTMTSPN